MLSYYLRLALKSFRRTPGLTALMVCAIGLGIGVCIVTMTVYHAMSHNPIWWKNDRLYAVTMDSFRPTEPYDKTRPQLPPPQMAYKDAMYLYGSNIPERKVVMYSVQAVMSGGTANHKPLPVFTRLTTADFFAMFDVPFLYGRGWDAAVDSNIAPVIVLSREENDKLFAGANSVGRTVRWNDREFRVIGVLDTWLPRPRFYDLNVGAFSAPEDAYIPLAWGPALELTGSGGNTDCWRPQPIDTYKEFLASDCLWIQMWVELPSAAARERMQAFMDAYWAHERQAGRFPRPRNNRLTNVGQWLDDNGVVHNDNRILVRLAFAFLAVCLINSVGILLAKFLSRAASTGVRRALGASRREIMMQHLVEVGALASAGALLGLALSALGLLGLQHLYTPSGGASTPLGGGGTRVLMHFDTVSLLWAVALAILCSLAAGLYPAWRIGRVPPSVYLKSQ